jgi:MFS family permease
VQEDPPVDGTTTPSARELVRDRSVAAFLASVTAATMAALAQTTALGYQVFELTGREIDLGLLGLAEFLPALVLAVPAWALADRFDRRTMYGLALAGEAVAVGGLAWLTWQGVDEFGPLLGMVVLFGSFRALAAPALRALPATLVAPGSLPRIVPMFSASWQIGLIAGPVLGGVLYATEPPLAYLGSVALLLLAIGVLPLLRLRRRAEPQGTVERPGWRSALDGLRVIRHNPVLLGTISLDLFAVLFGGAVALLPAIATTRLGTDASGLGWLRAAGGIGAALTTAALVARPLRRRIGPTLLVCVAIFGAATIVLGAATSFVVAFVALFVMSAADAVSVFVRATLVPLITPDEYRGRVLSVENVFIGASNELGAFESGLTGQLFGAPLAVVFGGAATLVVVAVAAVAFPALRRIDGFPPPESATLGTARPGP